LPDAPNGIVSASTRVKIRDGALRKKHKPARYTGRKQREKDRKTRGFEVTNGHAQNQ